MVKAWIAGRTSTGGRSWVAAKGDGVVLLCDGGDPWSVCNLL